MKENPVFKPTEYLDLSDPILALSVLDFVINLLQSRNQMSINAFKRDITDVIDREALHQLLIAAVYCLAETDFETSLWVLHHYDPEFYVALKQQVIAAAVKHLIERGFIPGKDFSALPSGDLMVHPVAKAVLLESASMLSSQLFREILHTFN